MLNVYLGLLTCFVGVANGSSYGFEYELFHTIDNVFIDTVDHTINYDETIDVICDDDESLNYWFYDDSISYDIFVGDLSNYNDIYAIGFEYENFNYYINRLDDLGVNRLVYAYSLYLTFATTSGEYYQSLSVSRYIDTPINYDFTYELSVYSRRTYPASGYYFYNYDLIYQYGYIDGSNDTAAFYDADWLGWIGNTLSSILDTELFMGFTLGGIFGICVIIAVSIWFLKMFAGG